MKRKLALLLVLNVLVFCQANAQCNTNEFTLRMHDTIGDGWTGNDLTIYELTQQCGREVFAGPFTLESGKMGTVSLCLPDGCYQIFTTTGIFPHEISWEITNDTDNSVLASGIAVENVLSASVGASNCNFVGCTDPGSMNYNSSATCSFATCVYNAPVNDEVCGALTLDCKLLGYIGSTESANMGEINSCKGYAIVDLWYTIVGTGEQMSVAVEGLADDTDMQITVLRSLSGDCTGPIICNSMTSYIKLGVNKKAAYWDSDEGAVYFINVGSKNNTPNAEFVMDVDCPDCIMPTSMEMSYVGTERAEMSWVTSTSLTSSTGIYVCPDNVSTPNTTDCAYYPNATSPFAINNLKACLDYDIYIEQICDGGAPSMSTPMRITTDEHKLNATPNMGEQVCYPPCHNGVETYLSNEKISWTYCAEEGYLPQIVFNYVDIETDPVCGLDRIELYGKGYSGYLCSSLNGDDGIGLVVDECYYSDEDGGCITLEFDSNNSVEQTGFCFEFAQILSDDGCIEFGFNNFTVPIELVSFEARAQGSKNVITWETANHVNNEWQILEKSTDQREWVEIDRKDMTNSPESQRSQFYDINPTDMDMYRLRSIDLDGNVQLFSPVTVRRENAIEFSISAMVPNPATDKLTVSFELSQSSNGTISISNVQGKRMLHQVLNVEATSVELDLSEFTSGIYFVNLESNGLSTTKRLVVNN